MYDPRLSLAYDITGYAVKPGTKIVTDGRLNS
jgi:hypothetical protein